MMKGGASLLIVVFIGFVTLPAATAFDECADLAEESPTISLEQLWEKSVAAEPAMQASEYREAAARAELRALQRWMRPDVAVEMQADVGQRARPGEERDQGIGVRGDILGSTTWTVIDSGRHWSSRAAQRRQTEEQFAGQALQLDIRALAVGAYIHAAIADERRQFLIERREELQAMVEVVERRVAGEVESRYDQALLDDAIARSDRLIDEARQEHELAVIELSNSVGHCARPGPLRPVVDAIGDGETRDVDGQHPSVELLRSRADSLEAEARSVERQGAWQFGVRGVAGIYGSQAFDDHVLPEYYVGGFGLWRPDFSGVRRDRASAEEERSRALRAEADSLQRTQKGERRRWAQIVNQAGERQRLLERERERAATRAAQAHLRWSEGVGSWTEVLDADERLETVVLTKLDFRRDVALAMVEYGVATATLVEMSSELNSGGP